MTLLNIFELVVFIYFLGLNGTYIGLNLLSIPVIHRYMQSSGVGVLPRVFSGFSPPISIITPAFNEEATILDTIHSLLELDYPHFEIIVVNDGSIDRTMEILNAELALAHFPEAYRDRLKSEKIRDIYRSTKYNNIYVIDKDNGDRADALNAGVNMAHYPYFCAVDADSVLQKDSLVRIVQPFLEDPHTVACGGTIRVSNGCEKKDGVILKPILPSNIWALFQVIEYLRAFLYGRLGWAPMNGLLIVSGAFGLFHKETFLSVGGYRPDALGEDMELIIRMHRLLKKRKKPYRITFVPDPVCWTKTPETFGRLMRQRIRWHIGHVQALLWNPGLMFSKNGGVAGWVAYPFSLFFEWLGPIVELAGYIVIIWGFNAGWISVEVLLIFLTVSVGFGMLLSTSALLLEEMSFHLYSRPLDIVILLIVALFENLGYRQINTVWRVMAIFRHFWMIVKGEKRWAPPPTVEKDTA
jgi:cellulose synthase/poly-beta-1,6-N-acetylglucosamine synthase-like glycosyltransferase